MAEHKLVVAEKPSVGISIAKVLGATELKDGYMVGNGYIVSWCIGHLVGLSSPEMYGEEYKKWSFDTLPIIPDNWKFSLNSSTKKQYYILKQLMLSENVNEIICATDAGREGECIFRYVYYNIGSKKPFKRLWVSSLEQTAISEGFRNLKDGKEYDNLFVAGFCRSKADWLVGMNGSRLFSIRYNSALNVGRVQTPTLAMIVQRDNEIKNFVKQKYFTAEIDCGTFTAATERIDDEAEARAIADKCNGKTAAVTSVKKEIKTVNPPKLYDLTTLQREANRQFGYTAQETLNFTQSLYEKKLCTYPRTDSQYITDDMENTARKLVRLVCKVVPCFSNLSMDDPDIKRIINNDKVSDHHALLPTAMIQDTDLTNLPIGEKNILSLISVKLICAVSSAHKYEAVKVELNCEDTLFSANGKTVISDGWKAIEKIAKARLNKTNETEEKGDSDKSLPDLSEGMTFDNVASSVSEHWTTPPKPYTEDTLLKAMETAGNKDYDEDSDVEKKGLGTPATRAAIIESLVKRGYIERNKKQLSATKKGIELIAVVPDEVKSPKMTADWESELQAIEKGKANYLDFMARISNYVKELCEKYGSVAENAAFKQERKVIGTCPKCGKNVIEYPKTYSCESGKDGCGFVIWKVINQAKINAEQAKKLITTRKTDVIKGFTGKSGKKFDHYLILNEENNVVFAPFDSTENKVIGTCPKCGKNILETFKAYSCNGGKDGCGFIVWKEKAHKKLPVAQVQKLLKDRRTDLITDFKKANGEKFSAYLTLNDNFETVMEFEKNNKNSFHL